MLVPVCACSAGVRQSVRWPISVAPGNAAFDSIPGIMSTHPVSVQEPGPGWRQMESMPSCCGRSIRARMRAILAYCHIQHHD